MRTTCYDIDSSSCQNMAIYCSINAYINGIFITDYCPFTCGLCKGFTTTTQIRTTTTEATYTTRKPACFDLYPECISYAYKGYCLRDFYINDTLIKDCCAFSCGTCVYRCKMNMNISKYIKLELFLLSFLSLKRHLVSMRIVRVSIMQVMATVTSSFT